MPPKTVRKALADVLENMEEQDFDKFRRAIVDRREEPRIRRNKVQGKSFLDIADVLVSTFTETKAVGVTVDLLRQIDCNQDADDLVEDTAGLIARPSAGGASSVCTTADGEHFVDKYRSELINSVTNVAPILDELLRLRVIQQESYDKIRALPVTQERVRELLCGPLRSSKACKDAFYEILVKNEPFLIAELKEKK